MATDTDPRSRAERRQTPRPTMTAAGYRASIHARRMARNLIQSLMADQAAAAERRHQEAVELLDRHMPVAS